MKRSKIVLLLAAVLVAVMVLSSCSIGTAKLVDILDGSRYKDEQPSLTTATKLETLYDASVMGSGGTGVFMLFSTEDDDGYDIYSILNVVTGNIIWTGTETEATSYGINFYSTDNARYDVQYVRITTRTYALDDEGNRDYSKMPTISKSLRAADGTEFATTTRDVEPTSEWDLIRFDNKCYRTTKDGAITYAFDYSDLATMPNIVVETADYYYAVTGQAATVVTLDKSFNIVSYYTAPSYAAMGAARYVALDNGKVLAQYSVREDTYGDDYDYLDANANKYSLHTVILEASGKTKEIKCNYQIGAAAYADEQTKQNAGLSDSVVAFAYVYPVEDQRINTAADARKWVTIDKNGKMKALDMPTAVPVNGFNMAAENRWILQTVDNRRYVMDETAKILGEVSGVNNQIVPYIIGAGKVLDYSLGVAYDYAADALTVTRAMRHGVLLGNSNGEAYLFANGTKTTVVNAEEADAHTKFVAASDSSYFMVVDLTDTAAPKTVIYNDQGTKLLDLAYQDGYVPTIQYQKNGKLVLRVRVLDTDTLELHTDYYTIH